MAIQGGNIDLQIAEMEARGIEQEARRFRGLGADIGRSISGAMQSAEILQRRAISDEKDKAVKRLLSSGAEGVNQYSRELGFDDRSSMMFKHMAMNVQNPNEFPKIYAMQKAKADKIESDKQRMTLLSGITPELEEAMTTADPEKIAIVGNKVNALKAKTTDKEFLKQIESIEKGLNDASNRSATGRSPSSLKAYSDALDLSRKEAAFFDKRIKEAKIIKDKAQGVRVAVSRAVQNSLEGKDPNNATLDQVLGVSLQKVLDPPSVVRESEFERLGLTQAFFDSVKGRLQSLSTGGIGLTDESRALTTQFIEDMNQIADRAIRKQMLTSAVRSGFGERFDLQEIDATLFNPEEVDKMRKMHSGEMADQDRELDERIRQNVQMFIKNPNILSGGSPTKEKASRGTTKATEDDVARKQARRDLGGQEKVKVRLPDGRVGSIPRANLQRALDNGAEVIE